MVDHLHSRISVIESDESHSKEEPRQLVKNIQSDKKAFLSIALHRDLATEFAGNLPIKDISINEIANISIDELQCSIIMCSLFSASYGMIGDASAAIVALKARSYKGMVIVIAPHLPKVSIVEKELSAIDKNIRVSVISL